MAQPDSNLWGGSSPIGFRKVIYEDLERLEWGEEYQHLRQLFWRSYCGQERGTRYLIVATVDNFPIGRLFILLNSKNTVLSDGKNRAYLYSFAVMSALQGRGIGTRLLLIAERLLLKRHYKLATIGVEKSNIRAFALYERVGYKIFGEDNTAWSYQDHEGNTCEVNAPSWLMAKRLVR